MKAKTKLQKQVVALSKTLKPITAIQENWALKHCFEHFAYRTKKGSLTCSDCGHTWQSTTSLVDTICGCTCPHCGTKLEVRNTRQRVFSQCEYFCILTTCKGFQVIRFVYVKYYCKKGVAPDFFCCEVAQRWISPKGESAVIARLRAFSCIYVDQWQFGSNMEIRAEHRAYNMISDCSIYPRKRFIPELKRNGFTGKLFGTKPFDLFCAILKNNKAETLLKSGQTTLLKHFIYSGKKISDFWESIKICNRKGYIIQKPTIWCDYIELLKYFNKDTQNAFFVCPDDLDVEHDKWMNKKVLKLEKERDEEKIRQVKENEEHYKEMKGKFLDLFFTDGVVNLHVLQSVLEFYVEGKTMHHCVFSNNYYKKPQSLVLSATVAGQKIETVEFSLESLKVVQSFGACNSRTNYHDQIVALVNKNAGYIQKRLTA